MHRPKVFAFSGGCVSGKTTTMHFVKERLEERGYRVGIVGENMRGKPIKSIDEIRKNPSEYLDIQNKIIRMKAAQESSAHNNMFVVNADVILIDRALSDSLFYLLFYVDKSNFSKKDWKFYNDLYAFTNIRAESHFKKVYDRVYEFEPLANVSVDDSYRPDKIDIQKHSEYRMISTLNKALCPPEKLKNLTLNFKPELVKEWIFNDICQGL